MSKVNGFARWLTIKEAVNMQENYRKVKKEAYEHFLVNGETYICKNDEISYFYCDKKDLQEINLRDLKEKLNPKVIGCWHENTLLKGIKLAPSYSKY